MRRHTLLCVFGCFLAITTNSMGLSEVKDFQADAGEFTPLEGHNMTINSSKVPEQKNRTNDTVTCHVVLFTCQWNGTWIPTENTEGFSSPLPDKKDKKKPKKEVAASSTTQKPVAHGTIIDIWSGLYNTYGFQTPPPDANVNKADAGEFTPMEGHNMTINSSKVPEQKNRTNDTVTWNGTWIPIENTEGFSSPLPDKKDKKKLKCFPLKFQPQKEVAASSTTQKPVAKHGTIIDDWSILCNTFGFQTPPPDGNVNKKEED
ncbi:uncharacterized protein LOC121628961 [Melanotaenia boesemani]|uniref:uncharacterized protein LOC121628961 n=1 Tax=Melanotaenia boesemani TaxID=1250792 RepID=UPI001C05D369|nr:uncharacterized protein LOC121628961 [Melanotaenia boesemani]